MDILSSQSQVSIIISINLPVNTPIPSKKVENSNPIAFQSSLACRFNRRRKMSEWIRE